MKGRRGTFVGAVAALLLVGCSGASETVGGAIVGDEEAVEEGVERMIEEQAAQDGATIDVEIDGGAQIPDTWPASVPAPEGELLIVAAEGGGHALVARVASADAARDYVDALESAGFDVVNETSIEDGGWRQLEGEGLLVIVSWTGGDDVMLSVNVQPDPQ